MPPSNTFRLAGYPSVQAAVTAAIAAGPGSEVVIPKGDHPVTTTIDLTAAGADGLTIRGEPGARLVPSDTPTGALSTSRRFFKIGVDDDGRDNITITGLTFAAPAGGYGGFGTLDADEHAAIHLTDSTNCTVADNEILIDHGGVFVKGAASSNNRVLRNRIVGGWIVYSYAGAHRTVAADNTITGSPANAMSGVGNGTNPATDNQVIRNTILDAGRMGIEDSSSILRTHIVGNTIRRTGDDEVNGGDEHGLGISAVGRATLVQGNTVIDALHNAIELAGTGQRCIGNYLKGEAGDRTSEAVGGIIVNGGDVTGYPRGATIADNTILAGFREQITLFGACGSVSVVGNIGEDYSRAFLSLESNDAATRCTAAANVLRLTTPVADSVLRTGFVTYSGAGTGGVGCRVVDNIVTYEAAADSGTGDEYFVRAGTNGVLVMGNLFDGGGISSSGGVPRLGGNGATNTGLKVIANTFVGGATYSLTGYTSPVDQFN